MKKLPQSGYKRVFTIMSNNPLATFSPKKSFKKNINDEETYRKKSIKKMQTALGSHGATFGPGLRQSLFEIGAHLKRHLH